MKNSTMGIIILVLLLVVTVVIALVGTFNKLQVLDESINSKWAQIENQLKRRNDLIPNLVNTVKGYAAHENEIFIGVAEARAQLSGAMENNDIEEVQKGNDMMNSALSRLLAIAENYPTLKADQNFIALQDELAGTENRLAVARMDYNDAVKTLNTEIRRFPTSLVAAILRIKQREYFEISETEKNAPMVDFSKENPPYNMPLEKQNKIEDSSDMNTQ